jgi:hypothetical protein
MRALEEIFAPIAGQRNGCSLAEYLSFAALVRDMAPCRLLVFGVGRDSPAWVETNNGGTTLFLENNRDWHDRTASVIGPELIQSITYQQPFSNFAAQSFSHEAVLLPVTRPCPFDRSWHAAFVDAPLAASFGRHQSVHAAAKALATNAILALHDCNRQHEQLLCRHILCPRGFELISESERLRVYRRTQGELRREFPFITSHPSSSSAGDPSRPEPTA